MFVVTLLPKHLLAKFHLATRENKQEMLLKYILLLKLFCSGDHYIKIYTSVRNVYLIRIIKAVCPQLTRSRVLSRKQVALPRCPTEDYVCQTQSIICIQKILTDLTSKGEASSLAYGLAKVDASSLASDI